MALMLSKTYDAFLAAGAPDATRTRHAAELRLRERDRWGAKFSIVVVAEGAFAQGGTISLLEVASDARVERLGGVGARVSAALGELTGKSLGDKH